MSTQAGTGTLKQAYDHCQAITKASARNFYYAFVTLPSSRRRAIYAAYAFSRLADDIADGDDAAEIKANRLETLRRQLHDALEGNPEGPVLTALADACKNYHIPESLFQAIVDGVTMDLLPRRYATFDDLRTYCYQVAAVVGLVSIQIFGYKDPRANEYAVDLGIAMQLTNIIRDIREDAELGRVYLPLDELDRFGYTEAQLTAGTVNGRFQELMKFQAARAREYFESGAKLMPLLTPRSRGCAAGLHHLYSSLLDRIEHQGFDVFSERVSLPAWQKLRLTLIPWAVSFVPRRQGN